MQIRIFKDTTVTVKEGNGVFVERTFQSGELVDVEVISSSDLSHVFQLKEGGIVTLPNPIFCRAWRQRITLIFTLDEEQVPGMFHNPQEFADYLAKKVKHDFHGYRPIIEVQTAEEV